MLGAHGHDISAARCTESYRPRRPEESVLYTVMAGNLETFLARQQQRCRPVPVFVEREMRAFLECGVLACGFLRLFCDQCGRDKLVPLACKRRGFCPSCCGRRMADTAAHLVDRVFPLFRGRNSGNYSEQQTMPGDVMPEEQIADLRSLRSISVRTVYRHSLLGDYSVLRKAIKWSSAR